MTYSMIKQFLVYFNIDCLNKTTYITNNFLKYDAQAKSVSTLSFTINVQKTNVQYYKCSYSTGLVRL